MKHMDLLHILALDIILPSIALFTFLISLPTVYFLRFVRSFISFFRRENVRGKVVLITGASSGVGEQVAYQYALRGAILVLVAHTDERLRAVTDRSRKLGARHAHFIVGDVAKEADCKRFIDETIQRFVDHLVSNAGTSHSFLFEEATDLASFNSVMDITFWGNIYTTFYALPHLKRSRGKIIANASSNAWLPVPRMSMYNAAKAGIFNFYETLRIEVGQDVGITIVSPFYIEKEMTKGKLMNHEHKLETNDEQRDIQVDTWPAEYLQDCAKAIINGTLRGKRHIQVPTRYNVLTLFRVFIPEIYDWFYHLIFVRRGPHDKPFSKEILDITSARSVLYPPSIQNVKSE